MNEMKRRIKNTHIRDGEQVMYAVDFQRRGLKQIVNTTLELTFLFIP